MGLEGGAKCIKWLVFTFNFLFFVCGVGLMAVGVYVQLKIGDFAELSTVKYVTGSILIIAVGGFIALVSFLGCCGAVKENNCFLGTFFTILLFILCAEIAGTALGYVYRDKLEIELKGDLNSSLLAYGQSGQEGITKAYDALQKKEKCCGVYNYTDWQGTHFTNGSHNVVPDSCCKKITSGCGRNFALKDIHTKGCYTTVLEVMKSNLYYIFAAGVIVAVIQITAMIFAIILICKIRDKSSYA